MFRSEGDILREASKLEVKKHREEERRQLSLKKLAGKFVIKKSSIWLQIWLTAQIMLNFISSYKYA